jgi:hypothetical protein
MEKHIKVCKEIPIGRSNGRGGPIIVTEDDFFYYYHIFQWLVIQAYFHKKHPSI